MVSCGFTQVLEALTGSLHWSSVWGSNDAGAVTNVMFFFLKMETSKARFHTSVLFPNPWFTICSAKITSPPMIFLVGFWRDSWRFRGWCGRDRRGFGNPLGSLWNSGRLGVFLGVSGGGGVGGDVITFLIVRP